MSDEKQREAYLASILESWKIEAGMLRANPVFCIALVETADSVKPVILSPADLDMKLLGAMLRSLADRIDGGHVSKANVTAEPPYNLRGLFNWFQSTRKPKGPGDATNN